ncbi:hypothetical protein GS500_16050 [Rhodococcus hoagii]|nr:hypothetical protein [Prescottella equi]
MTGIASKVAAAPRMASASLTVSRGVGGGSAVSDAALVVVLAAADEAAAGSGCASAPSQAVSDRTAAAAAVPAISGVRARPAAERRERSEVAARSDRWSV